MDMDTLKKNLEQREKDELIAVIMNMVRQEPDMQGLLKTPLPTASSLMAVIDPKEYRQQVLAAMAVGENQRQRKRGEVERRLTAIRSIADEFAAQENYAAALTIYEVLVTEIIEHFNDYRDEYVAFSVMLMRCIDGLDSCFAGEEDNPEMRLRVLRTLFAIYRFYMDSGMDLDEDIPGLLVGNATSEEREIIAGWVRDALTHKAAWDNRKQYEALLAALERGESEYD
ncbi:MAG TPA: hypothetical protein VNG51_27940 [Ktedonobacteraceae bacterium]|nr:hypothetical protein [Ktedonobacteraceae bacterium]